ncbi:MAG: PQQ-dependent sugar dehydrogenase [Gemmatimonadales bacterium]
MPRSLVLAAAAAALVAGAPLASQNPSPVRRPPSPACAPDNVGLTLPSGFCAVVVADSLGRARHLAALPNGDLAVAIRGAEGGVQVLRDTTGDGVADVIGAFAPPGGGGGTGIAFSGGALYFATDAAVFRWRWQPGQLEPGGPPDTVVSGLTNRRSHAAKGIALGPGGALFVNIGAPSNACQEQDRTPGSAGQDPCPLLEIAGGIWRFDVNRTGQTQADGERYATGLRNALALAVDPASGDLFAAQHGRDQLAANWPALYTEAESAELPAEEVFRIEEGGDYGWPYCYYDPGREQKVLGPEYGGDGERVGRCASADEPVLAFPAHWAPNAITFYSGTAFPAKYRGGLFIAFHGSWNRAPLPQGGYKVMFVPFASGKPAGEPEVFADGFAGSDVSPGGALHRPTGLAVGPDGSLYVSDDKGGRVYKIVYRR